MDFDIDYDIVTGLLISFLIGAIIGFEREYHSKAAGLRTMIMICLGSTIFTEISLSIGLTSPDRIASNIITGIGFLGAGVIFKDGLSISGITTATTIWITAALGMAAGAGEFFIAIFGTVMVLLILIALSTITQKIEAMHQARSYLISFIDEGAFRTDLESEMNKLSVKYFLKKDFKREDYSVALFEVYGGEKKLNSLNTFLKHDPRVKAYEY
jgi:putative Mg2+ transporter-C (MgtC) family protein